MKLFRNFSLLAVLIVAGAIVVNCDYLTETTNPLLSNISNAACVIYGYNTATQTDAITRCFDGVLPEACIAIGRDEANHALETIWNSNNNVNVNQGTIRGVVFPG